MASQILNSPLDNPIWNAFTGKDAAMNIGNGNIVYPDDAIAPFIGMPAWTANDQYALLKDAPADRSWFLLIADPVQFIPEFEVVFTIPLFQCTCSRLVKAPVGNDGLPIVPLNKAHIEEMVALTALTKPGPFRDRTIEFGNYHGIFDKGKLVAMGGERMHIENYTEVSAICTHPDHLGKGYGARITHFLADSVLKKGQIPFLHARIDNDRAISVYRNLGFEIRRTIEFYIFRRKR